MFKSKNEYSIKIKHELKENDTLFAKISLGIVGHCLWLKLPDVSFPIVGDIFSVVASECSMEEGSEK